MSIFFTVYGPAIMTFHEISNVEKRPYLIRNRCNDKK